MKTKTYTVYKFNELSDEAKEKAINRLRDINVDYDWWDGDWYLQRFDDAGIEYNTKRPCYFDLDRGAYFTLNEARIFDSRLFLKSASKAGYKFKYSEAKAILNGENFYTSYYAGRVTSTKIDVEPAQEYMNGLESEALSELSREYDYRTSDKAIIETIESNDYDFTVDGNLD